MIFTIDLTPEAAARLQAEAARQGKPPAAVLTELLEQLPAPTPNEDIPSNEPDAESQGLLALFAQWDEEDAAMTEAERDEAEAQWQDFREGINAARREQGAEPIY